MSSLSRFALNDSESTISPRGSIVRIRYQYLPSDSTSTIHPRTSSRSLVLGHMCKGSCCEGFNKQRDEDQETCVTGSKSSEIKDEDHYTALAVTSSATGGVKSPSKKKEDQDRHTASAVTSSGTYDVKAQSKKMSFDTLLDKMTAGSFNEHVDLLKYLGGGTYGLAFTARDKHNPGREYVVKFIHKTPDSHKEVKLMTKIKGHQNVVNITGAGSNNKFIQVFMPLDGRVTLESFVKINQHLVTENVMRFFFNQMASAVNYIHNLEIAHLDIKPDNMIINENFNIRLIDFGLAKDLTHEGYGPFEGSCGTFNFMAPEMLQGEDSVCHPKEADVWSLGATLYSCLYGHLPFHYDENDELDIDNSPIYKNKGENSPELANLFKGALNLIVSCRYDIFTVMYHAWCLNTDCSFDRQQFQFEQPTANQAESDGTENVDVTEEVGDGESATSSLPAKEEIRIVLPKVKGKSSPAALFILTEPITEGGREIEATQTLISNVIITTKPKDSEMLDIVCYNINNQNSANKTTSDKITEYPNELEETTTHQEPASPLSQTETTAHQVPVFPLSQTTTQQVPASSLSQTETNGSIVTTSEILNICETSKDDLKALEQSDVPSLPTSSSNSISGSSKLDNILKGSRLLVQGALAIYHGCWPF